MSKTRSSLFHCVTSKARRLLLASAVNRDVFDVRCGLIMSHQHDSCCSHVTAPSLHQTLDELDFERGIWSAAKDGDLERVMHYLKHSGDPNAKDSARYTPLLYSSRSGHLKVCEVLLEHGADCNYQTPSGGSTALHRAAYCGHDSVVNLLINTGANTLLTDSDGKTALHKAVENRQEQCMVLLIKSSKELLDIQDNKGQKPRDFIDSLCLPFDAGALG